MNLVEQLRDVARDARYAVRALRRAPWFVLAAAVSLALGIGVNTVLFSYVNGVLLRPVPLPGLDRLVKISQTDRDEILWETAVDGATARRVEELNLSKVTLLSGYRALRTIVSVTERTEVVYSNAVRGGYFEALGVSPRLGRLLSAADDHGSTEMPVVISERLWGSWFDRNPEVIGRVMRVGGRPHVLVGVVPEWFRGIDGARFIRPDIWTPLTSLAVSDGDDRRHLFARLTADVTTAQADVEVRAMGMGLDFARPERGLALFPLSDAVHDNPPAFYVAAGITLALSTLVLLIACGNVSNLLLARISTRESEIAVRLALGAGRYQIIRLVLVEVVLLVLAAGSMGLGVAFATVRWLGSSPLMLHQGGVLPSIDASLDWRVMTFAFAAAAVSACGIASVVAARVCQTDAIGVLSARAGAGGSTAVAASSRRRLVAVQVASAVVLLVAAGLLVRSVLTFADRDVGFDIDRVVTGRIDYQLQGYSEERTKALARAVLQAVADAPGIAHAAVASTLPGLSDPVESAVVQTANHQLTTASVSVVCVSTDFFTTLGMQRQEGRAFEPDDIAGAERVAIVNRSAADRLWPGTNAIGQPIRFQHESISYPPLRVIGIVPDTVVASSTSVAQRVVFAPIEQRFPRRLALTIIARGPAPRDQLLRSVREAVESVDRTPLYDLQGLRARVNRSMAGVRMMAEVFAALGLLGLVIAVVGVYGVVAHLVSHRAREFRIMKALGCSDFTLCCQVAREGTRMLLAGLLPGIGLAIAAGFVLRRFLVGVEPYDLITLAIVAAAVGATGLIACVIPALNAVRGDSSTLLKEC